PKFKPVKAAIEAGLKNLNKWYKRTDNSNAYFICLVLDPSSKLAYVEEHWDHEWLERGKIQLETVVNLSKHFYLGKFSYNYSSPKKGSYAQEWMRTAVRGRLLTERSQRKPRQELEDYLTSPLEEKCDDVVRWWGQHQHQYPTLARIARDYLAIQASAVASERTFSSAGITGTDRRSCLLPETFEALQILKSGYKNGFIS
ncbi:hypothetical protein M422DRAFT_103827, partial [Sphaerobolus stellatus SS14]